MPEEGWDATIAAQLDAVRKDLADLRDLVRGRPDVGWHGILSRIEAQEARVNTLKEVQDSFVRDRDKERQEMERRESSRVRVQNIMFTVFGAIMSGIVVQLFVLIANSGGAP